jgi:hypothetical protein
VLEEIEVGAALENSVPLLLWKSPHHAPPNITNGAAPASLELFVPSCGCSHCCVPGSVSAPLVPASSPAVSWSYLWRGWHDRQTHSP